MSLFSSVWLDPTAGEVTAGVRLCRALNTKEHNVIHIYVCENQEFELYPEGSEESLHNS